MRRMQKDGAREPTTKEMLDDGSAEELREIMTPRGFKKLVRDELHDQEIE